MKNRKKIWKPLLFMLCAVLVMAVQIARHANTYPVSLPLFGDGIGHTIYIASCEPYSTYMDYHDHPNWMYLFQAPLGDDFDAEVEMLIYGSSAGSDTYMDKVYRVETFQTRAYGTELLSWDNLVGSTQKSLNKLAPLTSQENPLYLTWCGGNLYGVVNDTAYLLFQGEHGRWLFSLPEIYHGGHDATVVTLGPITQADYETTPASPS